MQLLRFSVEFSVFLYLCVVLLSHQTLFHCADGKISRWTEREKRRRGLMCVFEHPQWQRQVEGGGEVWEECRGQGPLLPPPSPLVLPSLLCLLFLRFEIRCQCSCVLHVRSERKEVCLFSWLSADLWVEMFNHSPAVLHKETSPY